MPEEKVIVRVFCDYIATLAQGIWDYPLYCDDENDSGHRYFENYCTLCAEDAVILNELVHWNIQYDTHYFDFESSLQFKEDFDKKGFDPEEFTETGKKLAFRLKCNHPDWEVRFYDDVASTIDIYADDRPVDDKACTHWYSVRISSTGERLLLPLSKRKNSDGSWNLFLESEKNKS